MIQFSTVTRRLVHLVLITLPLAFLGQLALFPSVSFAEKNFVVKATSLPAKKITGLVWFEDELEIKSRKSPNRVDSFVELNGSYSRPHYDLYILNHLVPRAVSGGFSVQIRCKEKPVLVSIRVVGPGGVVETEQVLLQKISKQTTHEQ